jgi:HD-GYP domain-containing protein (c-di-GMP phosphodiesterase class II)
MTSPQSYRPRASREDAIARMREGAGTQFDAALVNRFLGVSTEIAG